MQHLEIYTAVLRCAWEGSWGQLAARLSVALSLPALAAEHSEPAGAAPPPTADLNAAYQAAKQRCLEQCLAALAAVAGDAGSWGAPLRLLVLTGVGGTALEVSRPGQACIRCSINFCLARTARICAGAATAPIASDVAAKPLL